MKETAKTGFVLGSDGRVLVQLPADNQFGFVLADEESTWAGGIGSGFTTWKLVDQSQVSPDDVERLGWLIENAEAQSESVRFTYEVDGSLSLFGQDAAYAVCTVLEKRRAKDGKLTKEIFEAAAKLLNTDYETESEDGWTAESLAAAVKNCTFGRRISNGMACNHDNVSHATSSSWESVCADCGEVIDRVQANQ